MSRSLKSLDSRSDPEQHQQYEHVAQQQPEQHMAAQVPAQRVGRTERVQMMLGEQELRDVDDFRFAERCPSRSEAIRVLMQRGLQASRGQNEKDGDDAR